MSQSLSRRQAVTLGLVVLVALTLGGYGITHIADKQGVWADTVELTAGFPEAHDITPGTPVRLRGVDAGQVVAVEYPDHDGPGAEVTVRMKIQARYASRLYADADAQVHGTGLLGSKVISVRPGDPTKGVLAGGRLRGVKPFQIEEAVAEVRDLAKEAKGTAAEVKQLAAESRETVAAAKSFIKGVEDSNGTLAKLVSDDALYEDARGTLATLRKVLVGMEAEMGNLNGFVSDGRDTLRSVRQGTDALSKMPIVRSYVEDSVALLVRPTMNRHQALFQSKDIFEPGTATLTSEGRRHMDGVADWLNQNRVAGSEVIVAAFHDPRDKHIVPAVALELTRKQAEVVAEHLKNAGATKLGTFSRRKVTPLGVGTGLSPAEPAPDAPSNVQILTFTPR